jgi:outer membrane receptor protein involved in Fe transport
MAAGDIQSPGGDLNFVPATLVKRVDILSGGASSAYGADAVGGVVNFVMDTEFEGLRGEVTWNGFQHNNNNALAQEINAAKGFTAPSGSMWNYGGTNFNLAVGGKFGEGKGHATAYVDYRDIGDIMKDQRDYTNCSVASLGETGPVCGGSSTWQYGRFIDNNGASWVLDPSTGNTDTFRKRKSSDVFNYAPYNFMQRNDTRWSGGGVARYTVSKAFEPYAEVMFMNDYSDAQIAPSGDFGNTLTMNCDNPMMSAQQRAILCTANGYGPNDTAFVSILRRNVEGGNRTSQLTHNSWRMLAGVRGDINPTWHYDVYALNATVSAPQTYINDLSVARLEDALNVVGTPGDPSTWHCASGNPGCVPWDIFKIGGVTRAATDYLATPLVYDSGTGTRYLAATLRGDLEKAGLKLPSATEGLQLALGAWYSKNTAFVHPDDTYQRNPAAGQGGPVLPVDGSYTTKEGYGELRIPLVQDTRGAKDLSLEFGYRYMSYKALDQAAKNNSSYKTMLSWAPVNGLRLRGGFNRSVRAPNVYELFQQQGLDLRGTTDICAGESPAATLEQCQRTGVTAAQYGHILENPAAQYNSFDGGNPNLDVEKADTITAGFVWTPKSITGLSVTADYFDIHVKNTIRYILPDDTIQACANTGDPSMCGLVHRDRFGTLWLTTDGYTVDTNQNVGDLYSRGLDISANYLWNLGHHGFINLQLLGTTMFEDRLTTPLINYDCVGYYGNQCQNVVPKWRHRVRATWNTNFKASFAVGWRFINHVLIDDASPEKDLGDPSQIPLWQANGSYENPTFNYIDLAATYRFKDKLILTAGCNNILDKEPPLGSGVSPNDYGTGMYGIYDPLGRSIYVNLQFGF